MLLSISKYVSCICTRSVIASSLITAQFLVLKQNIFTNIKIEKTVRIKVAFLVD